LICFPEYFILLYDFISEELMGVLLSASNPAASKVLVSGVDYNADTNITWFLTSIESSD
jgi:hypothetical protein